MSSDLNLDAIISHDSKDPESGLINGKLTLKETSNVVHKIIKDFCNQRSGSFINNATNTAGRAKGGR